MTWNRGAERLFGYSAEEAVGKSITMLIPPDHFDEEPGILARIRKGEMVDHFETVRRRKDGSLFDISLTISPVRDAKGRIVGASKIARDISERKEAEARPEGQPAPPAGTSGRDPGHHLHHRRGRPGSPISTRPPWSLPGAGPGDRRRQVVRDLEAAPPRRPAVAAGECPMAVSLREGRPVRGVEAVAERPDGTRVPFIPYPTPMLDANGEVVGSINMLVDVSERKQAETQQRILLASSTTASRTTCRCCNPCSRQPPPEPQQRGPRDTARSQQPRRRDGGRPACTLRHARRHQVQRGAVPQRGLPDGGASVLRQHPGRVRPRRRRALERHGDAARLDHQRARHQCDEARAAQ